MPIRRELRRFYGAEWRATSIRIRTRAGGKCEWCGAKNGLPHPTTGSHVVLTVAHLDQDPRHCDDSNLAALCQKCHLGYDRRREQRARFLAIYAEILGQLELPFG